MLCEMRKSDIERLNTSVVVASLADGLERRVLLSGDQFVPVYAGKEFVSFDLFDSSGGGAQPIVWIPLEKASQQILSFGAQKLRHPQFSAKNLLHGILSVLAL